MPEVAAAPEPNAPGPVVVPSAAPTSGGPGPVPQVLVRGGSDPGWGPEPPELADVVSHLLRARGTQAPAAQAALLSPKLSSLRRPDAMAGFDAALDRIERALTSGETIGVFGDYDVDGVTTATILSTYLEALGATVVVKVAHRGHGYGFTVRDASGFAEAGATLVLIGDCGTSDIEALSWLAERGIGRVVIDHHQVPDRMPPTDALINPHQAGCGFEFKGLCSAGVAFYLCAALRTRLAKKGRQPPDPRAWLDLVALATVCDMMPLEHENRVLVHHGVCLAGHRLRPGLKALLRQAGVDDTEPLDESHFGFKIGPRINAPGRLGSALPSLALLRARTDAEAGPLAEQVEALNAQRKQHTQRTAAEAMALLAADPRLQERAAVVVHHHGWLAGVVGIAAAGLVDHYGRPALVMAVDPKTGEARGSVRSIGGVDVRAALAACSELVVRFGGHPQAAGVTVMADKLDAFSEAFDAAVAEQSGAAAAVADVELVDAELPLASVDMALIAAMRAAGPFGMGFAAPRFVSRGVRVESAKIVGTDHLAMRLSQGRARFDTIAFGQAKHRPQPGSTVGVVHLPFVDRFRGDERLRLGVQRFWSE